MKIKLTNIDALIIVDVQKDFCPGGALPVPEGDRIIPVLNTYIERFEREGLPIFATRDWHPENHKSFKEQGGLWPVHCVQKSEGAKFHPDLKLPPETRIISKATKPGKEAYSGFQDTNLKPYLKKKKVKRIFVGGLATDYCVKKTVLDGLKAGFTTVILIDAIKGVELNPGDSERAIEEMLSSGAIAISSEDIKG